MIDDRESMLACMCGTILGCCDDACMLYEILML